VNTLNRRFYKHAAKDYGLGRSKVAAPIRHTRKWLLGVGLLALASGLILDTSLTHLPATPSLVENDANALQPLKINQPAIEFLSPESDTLVTIATQTLVDINTPPQKTPEGVGAALASNLTAPVVSKPAVTVPVVTPAKPIPSKRAVNVAIKRGDTVAKIFEKQGFDATLLHDIMDNKSARSALTKIHPGQTLKFTINPTNELIGLEYNINELERLVIDVKNGQAKANLVKRDVEELLTFAKATIDDSLFMASEREGIDHNITLELARIFGWDIDFALDIHRGDTFSVIYEDRYIDGQRSTPGDIIAAEFVNQGKVYRAIRYESPTGQVDYYTPEGHSMRKAFIRTPVEFARVSSKFNPHRRHPILHTIRAHKGVDYAAATGTPVRATSDGVIAAANTQKGYGKVIEIQHGKNYSTLYAHLNGYAKGITKGTTVKQGQIIGYVGMTGMATGPHLHYEFRVNGVHKDPLTVELPNSDPIHAKHKPQFLAHVSDVLEQLSNYQNVELAQVSDNPLTPAEQDA